MTGQTKTLLIIAILIGGLLLALPFRHSQEEVAMTTAPSQDEVWLKKTDWIPVEAEPAIQGGDEQSTSAESGNRIEPTITSFVEDFDLHQDLKPIHTPVDQRPSATLGHTLVIPNDVVPVKKPENRTNAPTRQPNSSKPVNIAAKQTNQRATVVKHLVRDGDTLQSLAQRYLGDGRRAIEIFNTNRDKLKNPQMLPVNEELLIEVNR